MRLGLPTTLTILLLAVTLGGCTQGEIEAWNRQNEMFRQQLAEVRAEVQVNTNATPAQVDKIEKILDYLEAGATQSEVAANRAEDANPIETVGDVAKGVSPFLPFPFNILVGAVGVYATGQARRKWVENKLASPPVPNPPS